MIEEIKLHSLKLKIGKILKSNRYYSSQTTMYGRSRGYYYDGVYGSKVAKNSYLTYHNGNTTRPSEEAEVIKTFHRLLTENGLGDYIEPLNDGDEIIKFKNVK